MPGRLGALDHMSCSAKDRPTGLGPVDTTSELEIGILLSREIGARSALSVRAVGGCGGSPLWSSPAGSGCAGLAIPLNAPHRLIGQRLGLGSQWSPGPCDAIRPVTGAFKGTSCPGPASSCQHEYLCLTSPFKQHHHPRTETSIRPSVIFLSCILSSCIIYRFRIFWLRLTRCLVTEILPAGILAPRPPLHRATRPDLELPVARTVCVILTCRLLASTVAAAAAPTFQRWSGQLLPLPSLARPLNA